MAADSYHPVGSQSNAHVDRADELRRLDSAGDKRPSVRSDCCAADGHTNALATVGSVLKVSCQGRLLS
jgi:hypothetical protein